MLQILVEPSASAPIPVTIPGTDPTIFAPFIGAVVLLILFICAFVVIRRKFQRPDLMDLTPEQVKIRWEDIMKTSDQGIMGAKLALMEADKLLDHVLKSMMMPGETLGERLKMAAYKYPAISQVWNAHKLRNQLVHDSAFQLRTSEVKRALADFRNALRALRVL
jgi:hypothetical protein